MYLKKLHSVKNYDDIHQAAMNVINQSGWGHTRQISLKRRPTCDGDIWFDGVGSLYESTTKNFLANERDFTVWNLPQDNTIYQAITELESADNFISGRVRIMKLLPKTGLSVHHDTEVRYHLVLETNPKSYFCWNNESVKTDIDLPVQAVCYHMPKDYSWYYVDTRLVHWVYNGGHTERIHIVVCAS